MLPRATDTAATSVDVSFSSTWSLTESTPYLQMQCSQYLYHCVGTIKFGTLPSLPSVFLYSQQALQFPLLLHYLPLPFLME